MANTTVHQVSQWNNFHSNGPYPLETLLDIDTDRGIPDLFDRYNDAAAELQRLIQESLDSGKRLRAYGSAWSMSNIAHCKDRMLFNARMNIKLPINRTQVHVSSPYEASNLFFFQCGTTIKEINEYLLPRQKSLKTCGASNGQTIAGAISTGVHGSAIDVGSIQDYVVGLNLVIGPNPSDVVYLERQSKPALSDEFAASVRSRVIRDDDMFNAALVGLGAFGIIHGVALEAEPLYLLKRFVRKIKPNDAMSLANTLNFADSGFRIKGEMDANNAPKRPFHFKYFINAYKEEDYITEYIFKEPYRPDYPSPQGLIKKSIYKDLPSMVAKFAAKHKHVIPKLVTWLGNGVLGRVDSMVEGTLGEIFWDTDLKMSSLAGSFGVSHTDSERALHLLKHLMRESGPIPGLLAMRFVKGSEATLGFTRFPITCVVEVDCIKWEPNDNMISFDKFMERAIQAFKDAGIPFTLHWGKNAPWYLPNLVNDMYGEAAVKQWKSMRAALLGSKMADLFTNDFLETVNLQAEIEPPII